MAALTRLPAACQGGAAQRLFLVQRESNRADDPSVNQWPRYGKAVQTGNLTGRA